MKVGLGNLRCAAGAEAEAQPKPERKQHSGPRTRSGSRNPASCAAVDGCTTRQHKTHRTTIEEVHYPWHPWFGQRVVVVEGVRRSDHSVCRCRLEGDESGRGLELPQWMLDRASCLAMRAAAEPVVRTSDFANLRILLRQLESGQAEKAVEDQHPSSIPHGDADVPSTRSPTSDAVGTVSKPSVDAELATIPDGCASQGGSSLGTFASRPLSRPSREGDER